MAIEKYTNEDIIHVPVEVEISEIPLKGEPATDRAYQTANGTKFRVRVVPHAEHAARAPVNGEAAVAPMSQIFSVTLALLNDDMTVAKDEFDRFQITDRHEFGLSDVMMQNEAFDAETGLMARIRQDAAALEKIMTNRKAAANYLAQHWGGAVMPPPPEPEPIPDPAEPAAATA